MIINSDHSIITTPVESPQTDVAGSSASRNSPKKPGYLDSDDTLTTDTSSSEAAAAKSKRHRPKARSESNRSEKYENLFFWFLVSFLFNWVFRFSGFPEDLCPSVKLCH